MLSVDQGKTMKVLQAINAGLSHIAGLSIASIALVSLTSSIMLPLVCIAYSVVAGSTH